MPRFAYLVSSFSSLAFLAGCHAGSGGSSGHGEWSPPDGGDPGPIATCTGMVRQSPPPTNACTGDAAACLSGTAETLGFTAGPMHRCASVYRAFPQGTATPLQTQLVADDDTWAFSGLPAWGHYYVVVVDDFATVDGGSAIPAIAGPLTVPVGSPDGGAGAVRVKPVQLSLLESRIAGGGWLAQWASAHVFDPSSGSELEGSAQVGVSIGGTPVGLPWVAADAGAAGASSYFVQFSPPPAAQATYTLVTTAPGLGSGAATWTLRADPPSFDGVIATPTDGATVPVGTALSVTWNPEPSADYELTEVFQKSGAAWKSTYTSPQPNDSTVTSETIPNLPAGQYLLNVALTKANCPPAADGCVLAAAIAAVEFTVQ